jgi:hypothetical protein
LVSFQEIDVKISAAKFPVGHAFEAHLFLEFDDAAYGFVFHRTQFGARAFAALVPLAQVEQFLGAQKAADVIGTERG